MPFELDETPDDGGRRRPIHPFFVAIPIGAWTCCAAFDVASLTMGESFWARSAMWLATIGLAGAVVAGATGFVDRRRLPPGGDARRLAATHAGVNTAAAALWCGSLVVRRLNTETFVDGTPLPAVALSALGLGFVLAGLWSGNTLVFTEISPRGPTVPSAGGPGSTGSPHAPRAAEGRPVHPAVAAARERRRRPDGEGPS